MEKLETRLDKTNNRSGGTFHMLALPANNAFFRSYNIQRFVLLWEPANVRSEWLSPCSAEKQTHRFFKECRVSASATATVTAGQRTEDGYTEGRRRLYVCACTTEKNSGTTLLGRAQEVIIRPD